MKVGEMTEPTHAFGDSPCSEGEFASAETGRCAPGCLFLLASATIRMLKRSSVKSGEEPRGGAESQAHLQRPLKVALLQMVSEGAAIEANARKGEEFCR